MRSDQRYELVLVAFFAAFSPCEEEIKKCAASTRVNVRTISSTSPAYHRPTQWSTAAQAAFPLAAVQSDVAALLPAAVSEAVDVSGATPAVPSQAQER